ncbi:MAG: CaiB/BaiF CoA-transferase family protein [Pseudomonadota bacterium]
MSRGALHGLKVLDFSTLLPGPMATLLLAEAGADVIKIERPGSGDDMRGYAPQWGTDSANFAMLNRGKRSLALDLKSDDAKAVLRPLIEEADVLIEQFRPGVMDRLGLGYAAVCETNADIIYCSITGYGQTGPKALTAGHDLNYIGDTGLLALASGPGSAPVVPPALIADIAGGAYPAIINILMALHARNRGHGGAHLDLAMTDGLFAFMYWALGQGQATGDWPGNGDTLVTGGSPRYQLYPTADGRIVAAAPIEPKFWTAFTEAIGLDPVLRDDSRDATATISAIRILIAAHPSSHWEAVFAKTDCCCSIVRSLEEALQDPHFRARGLFDQAVSNVHGQQMAALPVPVAAANATDVKTAPSPVLGSGADQPKFETRAEKRL